MHSELQLILTPEQAFKQELLYAQVAGKLQIAPERISRLRTLRKSIDSRSFQPKVNLTLEVYWDEVPPAIGMPEFNFNPVGDKPSVLVVGAGPAGLFAALRLIESG
ncbi:MAG TPA: hypothetical protein VK152_06265, partial [Paludibacter sp.]|nr:hypothetical protein [Paludibacter sp.]